MKTLSLFAVCVLFYFSGIAALTYEVLWVRHLGLIFGNTVYAAATVMMTYMIGLAVGAHYAGRLANRIKNPLKIFGILELATAFYALCIPFIFDLIQFSYKFVSANISDSMILLTVVRVFLSLVLLLIPTAMMGATLPVLAKGFLSKIDYFGSRLGLLYGVNTLGAVSGVLLAGFLFIPKLGMFNSNILAVSLDALVGISALLISSFSFKKSLLNEDEKINKNLSILKSSSVRWLLIAIGFSGFISLAMEVVWFRALILVFGSTTYSFSAMLGIFLVGLSIGSLIISKYADKIKNPALIFGCSALLIGVYTLLSLYFFTMMPEVLLRGLMIDSLPSWKKMIGLKFLITLIFLLIPTILFGISFTAATKAVRQEMSTSSEAVGEATMFNTIGAAIGAFFGGFILLPNAGMQMGLIICSCMALLLGALLLWHYIFSVRKRYLIIFSTLLVLFIFSFFPPKWDRQIISAGPYFSPWGYIRNGEIIFEEKLNAERLLYFNEGVTSTISVVRDLSEDLHYCSQGKTEADTTERSMMLQRMMGHLPMLFHSNPQQVLNIGLGAGVTFGAVSCYPAEHLEVVEFEPSVVNVARLWGSKNHNVLDHPNVTVTINDGRNHLFTTSKTYDVITSDPFEPVMAGAANLYTVDFFELAKSKLSSNGIMAQYLPLYELSYNDYQMIMRSFAEVFPDCIVFFTGFDTILLGAKNNKSLDLPIASEKFEIKEVKNSLAEIGFDSPEMLLSMFVARLSDKNKIWDAGDLNTDNRPHIEFSAPKSTFHYTPAQNQAVLLKHYSSIPNELIEQLTLKQREDVLMAHKAMKILLEANIEQSKASDKITQLPSEEVLYSVTRKLESAVNLSPNNPVIINEYCANMIIIADSQKNKGNLDQAFLSYNEILKYKPKEFWPIFHILDICMKNKEVKNVAYVLDHGLDHYPDSPLFLAKKGLFIAGVLPNQIDQAKSLFNKAIDALPNYQPIQDDFNIINR